jgi:hypothetical protein
MVFIEILEKAVRVRDQLIREFPLKKMGSIARPLHQAPLYCIVQEQSITVKYQR